MIKGMRIIIPLVVFSLAFSSCAGGAQASPAPSYDSGEAILNGRSSENDDRMVTYSASLEITVKDPDKTREMILEYVKIYNGFIVRESDNFITSRIPSKNMDNFLNSSKTLGKIENETKTGTDITDQYRDNILRLESLKNVRERYLALLDRADSVNDILSIEKELERVNVEIERLEGKVNQAELSVSYSSITVRFREKAKPGPVGWIFYGLYRGLKWLFVWN